MKKVRKIEYAFDKVACKKYKIFEHWIDVYDLNDLNELNTRDKKKLGYESYRELLKENLRYVNRNSKLRTKTASKLIVKNTMRFFFEEVVKDMIDNNQEFVFPRRGFGIMKVAYRTDERSSLVRMHHLFNGCKIHEVMVSMKPKTLVYNGMIRYKGVLHSNYKKRIIERVNRFGAVYPKMNYCSIREMNRVAKKVYKKMSINDGYYRSIQTVNKKFDTDYEEIREQIFFKNENI